MTEGNPEQSLADIEKAFEDSKALRMIAKHTCEAAKGRFHIGLVARREGGEKLTMTDMRALEAVAIEETDYVRESYLAFISADATYRAAKVNYETAKRAYWDGKPVRGL